ncbi:glycosyltransferase family 2 protein [Tabrizicola sp.]|jgi:hypothetical protein|uniref:glycosyltransferase family 2 protein n=1 Tax=Tabrizicola sp. TaxID=2005166 RepID=UPI0035B353B4
MIVGISVVKNEADVIETMARHNLAYLDHLTIVDNGSADETVDVVQSLIDEGLPCALIQHPGTTHLQHVLISDLVPSLVATYDPDRIIPLDADEFIVGDIGAFRREMQDRSIPLKLPWVTYVPMPDDDAAETNVLKRIVNRRVSEVPQLYKITVPAIAAVGAQVGPGSHRLHCNGKKVFMRVSASARLAHFPVRSAEQLIAKILIGSWSVRQRRRRRGEAYHWLDLAQRFLTSPTLRTAEMSQIALAYSGNESTEVVRDPVSTDIAVKMPVDPATTLLRKLIAYTEDLVRRSEGPLQGP